MTPSVEILTRDQLRRRRQELLESVGTDETALRRAAAEYTLNIEETAVLDEIDRIDYLLGD